MKTRLLIPLFVSLLVPGLSYAAKGKKNKKTAPTPATTSLTEPLKTYDANGNGKIDTDEAAAVKKAFGENPKGPLAALDKNSTGQLEDTEITPASSTASSKSSERPGKLLKQADKNRNTRIDPEEVAALQKSFDADPSGPLAKIDRNGNKKLDDKEIAKINERMGKGGKGKKGAAPAATTSSAASAASSGASASSAAKSVETVKPTEKPEAAK